MRTADRPRTKWSTSAVILDVDPHVSASGAVSFVLDVQTAGDRFEVIDFHDDEDPEGISIGHHVDILDDLIGRQIKLQYHAWNGRRVLDGLSGTGEAVEPHGGDRSLGLARPGGRGRTVTSAREHTS